ncbi:18.1 kDa class I heat shock protein-like [Solanum pennellii]|uniref:18.1 kDa class I heat shock protein-like n=1 Tax=Solanum pennellii TaxID=28526 RepID=A0ABM1FD96_SOLPN|nr:18.1 kDa class I heat shock protein-like [Solanum pennellii]
MSLVPLFNGRKNHSRHVQNSPPTTTITPQFQKNHNRSDSYDPTTTIMHQYKPNRGNEKDLYNYPPPTRNQDLHNLFNQLATTKFTHQFQTSRGQKDPYDPSHKFYLETPRSLIAPSLSFPHVTPFLAQFECNVTPEAYVFRANNLHGYKKEEVKVQVEDDRVLKISGEKKIVEKEYDNWHHFQKKVGKFSTVFNLPEDAGVDKVISTMEKEVLIVTIPKKGAVKKSHVRTVRIF